MASLTGNTIQSTYDSLLKVTDNDSITGSLKRITDGLGNNTPLYLSNSAVEIVSALNVTGVITGSNLSGTNTGDETKASIESKLGAATSSNSGYLTSTDWSTFNNKIAGAGTLNKLAKFSSSSSIADSTITDTGSAVTIGVATSVTGSLTASSIIKSGGTASQILAADGSVITAGTNITISGGTISSSGGISGSGTTNYVPKFNGATSLANSLIFDNGTNVGIGTTTPDVKFQVQGGTIKATTSNYASPSTGGAISVFQDSNDYGTIWAVKNYNGAWANIAIAPLGGNVGIGTSSPLFSAFSQLTVNGTQGGLTIQAGASGISRLFFAKDDTSNTEGLIRYAHSDNSMQFWAAATERMRITSAGNVGIGTSSPSQRLHIGGVGSAIAFDTTGAAGTSIIQTVEDYKLSLKSNRGTSTEIRIGDSNLEFFSNSTERMRITSGGRVLIGTTTGVGQDFVSVAFDSNSSFSQAINIKDTASSPSYVPYLVFRNNSDTYTGNIRRYSGSDNALYVGGNSFLTLGTGDVERMRITSTGNVGIGTTSPGYKLQVSGTSTSTMKLSNISANRGIIFGVDSASEPSIQAVVDNSDVARQLSINPSGGNVGIGNTSPTYRLVVNKVTQSAPALMIGGALYGGPRIQTYDLSADGNGWMGLGTDMSGAPYEHNVYFPDNGTYGRLSIGTYNGTTYSEKMCVLRTGNVGIGTTSPSAPLSFSDTAGTAGETNKISLYYAAGSGLGLYGFGISPNQLDYVSGGSHVFYLRSSGSSTERMRITSGGNVGIGTTNPAVKLDVSDSSTSIRSTSTATTGFGAASFQLAAHNGSSVSVSGSVFLTNSTFSYGTISPNQLNIYGTAGNGIRLVTNSAPISFATGSSDADFSTERMRITSGGNVLIGSTSDLFNNAKLQVTGGITYQNLFNRQTASYTLSISDQNYIVEMNVGSANNLTVPPNSTAAFPIGTEIAVIQYGAGQTTIVAGSGVTLRSKSNALKISGQYAGCTLVKIGTNEWYVIGDLTL